LSFLKAQFTEHKKLNISSISAKNRKAAERKFFRNTRKVYSKFHYFPLDFRIKIMYNFGVLTRSSRLKYLKKVDFPRKREQNTVKTSSFF